MAAPTAPVRDVMRDAAAGDATVRQLLREDDQRRYITQQALIDLVIGQDLLRAGCDRDGAVATFFVMDSHCYQLLATQLGWTPADWQRWLTGILDHEFFGAGGPAPPLPRARGRLRACPAGVGRFRRGPVTRELPRQARHAG